MPQAEQCLLLEALVPTVMDHTPPHWSLFGIFVVSIIMLEQMKWSLLAVFIVISIKIDSASNDDSNGRLFVGFRLWTVDLGRQIRILGVDLVEYIDKRIDV